MGINKSEIGKRIAKLRGRKGDKWKISQTEFSNSVGIDQAKLSHYETGRVNVPYNILKTLIGYCHKKRLFINPNDEITTERLGNIPVDADWILYGENPLRQPSVKTMVSDPGGDSYNHRHKTPEIFNLSDEEKRLIWKWRGLKTGLKPAAMAMMEGGQEEEATPIKTVTGFQPPPPHKREQIPTMTLFEVLDELEIARMDPSYTNTNLRIAVVKKAREYVKLLENREAELRKGKKTG